MNPHSNRLRRQIEDPPPNVLSQVDSTPSTAAIPKASLLPVSFRAVAPTAHAVIARGGGA